MSLEDDLDLKSLHRFLTGRAVGYVGAGGGGFGPAHIGIYKAFAERGTNFDLLGGASVGAAILGGFAMMLTPEEVDIGTHDVFVTSRGFKRFTFPRYALLDHLPFDRRCAGNTADICVEDAWRPFFAVATVLDGSGQGPYLIRRGPMWKAVRASGSLPAVLPPVFTDDGRMLVDGGVVDNVPLRSMKALKTGPEPRRAFRRARNEAAIRRGLHEHSGTLGIAPADDDAVRPAEAAAHPRPDRRAAALPGHEPESRIAAGRTARPGADGAALPGRELHGFRPALSRCSRRPIIGAAASSTNSPKRAIRRWRRSSRPRIELSRVASPHSQSNAVQRRRGIGDTHRHRRASSHSRKRERFPPAGS